ncbi:MAG: glutathione S-transferase [Polymorphobacter sp.]
MKIIIGTRTLSSWSLRGWLAAKQSGLPFTTQCIEMDSAEWQSGAAKAALPSGKVPVLFDGAVPVWDSMAMILWLSDKGGHDRYWPREWPARGLAYAMTAEMHSGFQALRSACPMNLQEQFPHFEPSDAVRADVARIDALWSEARDRFGAETDLPWLFGAFSAADIMYAPVVFRIHHYHLPVSATARAYVDAMLAHPWMQEWNRDAHAEVLRFNLYPVPGGIPA